MNFTQNSSQVLNNSSVEEEPALLNSDDATWILTSAFIIFTMQSGFGLVESGMKYYFPVMFPIFTKFDAGKLLNIKLA